MVADSSTFAKAKRANAALAQFEYRSGVTSLQSFPRAIFVELTQGCNLRCPMCRHDIISTKSHSMTDEMFGFVAETLFPSADLVDLRGWGESLILPDIVNRIRLVRYYGAKLRIVTNLSFHRDVVLDELVSANATVDVSLDTVDATVLDRVRTGANLNLITRNLRYLVDRFGHSRNLTLLVAVQQPAIEGLPGLVDYAADNGIVQLRLFSVTTDSDSPLSIANESVAIDRALIEVAARARARGVHVVAGTKLGSTPSSPTMIEACIHPWAYCYVSYLGEVGFCDHLIGPGNAEYIVGDLREMTFGEIWNGPKMIDLRQEHLSGRDASANLFSHCAWCYKNKNTDFEHQFDASAEKAIVSLTS
jgi:MoaA/NifB/PqqE/SkfB family radical SAM enzyme